MTHNNYKFFYGRRKFRLEINIREIKIQRYDGREGTRLFLEIAAAADEIGRRQSA